MSQEQQRLMNAQGRALDQAIDLLGTALRIEHESAHARRAEVLRGRLRNSERPGLRDRVATLARERD